MNHCNPILATISGADEHERLLVTVAADGTLALIQQTWAEGVGWYAQKTLAIQPEQAMQLRSVFGWAAVAARQKVRRPKDVIRLKTPKILPFEPAARAESA